MNDQRRELLEDRLKRQQTALQEDGPAAEAFWRTRIAETERRLRLLGWRPGAPPTVPPGRPPETTNGS